MARRIAALRRRGTVGAFVAAIALPAVGQSLTLHEEPGTVWEREQTIRGTVQDAPAGEGTVTIGDWSWPFELAGDSFSVDVLLGDASNAVIARWDAGGGVVLADTVALTLGYTLRPEAELIPSVEGRTVTLSGSVLANPDSTALTFAWEADPENPSVLALTPSTDSLASATIPETAPHGTYFFNWTVTDADGDAFRARTFVVVDSTGIDPFEIETEHAPWVDRAILYEITPYTFEIRGQIESITRRIPELVELGINTIWIQPVFGTAHGGQGYDITDYFGVRPDLGDEADAHTMIETAHAAGLRVLFDFVPNHSSIEHPYARDAIQHGEDSQYYDFYMREEDNAPYSVHYKTMTVGEMTFVWYFWQDLVTFNYDSPAVQRFIVEASRYWIEAFDIDGYRFDAVWGAYARNPDFVLDWRLALKRVKPEILMLAEAKAPFSDAFPAGFPPIFEAFDVAYDWTDEEDYISRWAFQTNQPEQTSFNTSDSRRVTSIRSAITNRGQGFPPDAKILRYLENNDTPRFIANHSIEMTRLAATLMYALPGIPMLYNGQETGFETHPYETSYIYLPSLPIREHREEQLFPFYQHLNWIKSTFPALHNETYEEVSAGSTSHLFAFRRWAGDEHVIAVVNPEEVRRSGSLELPVDEMGLAEGTTYYLTDLFTGEVQAVQKAALAAWDVSVNSESALLFALSDEAVDVPVGTEPGLPAVPAELDIAQNYPNPFADATTIAFTLPEPGPVRIRVYDVLGREVMTPLDRHLPAGRHRVEVDARGLAAGQYLYRIEQGGRSVVGVMTRVP